MQVGHSVTKVLLNPRWWQPIVANVMTKVVSTVTGRTEESYTVLDNDGGVIQPTKEDIFQQYPALDRSKEHITIWCPSSFPVGVTIVTWKENNYRVRICKDWSEYGMTGFYRSICERIELIK